MACDPASPNVPSDKRSSRRSRCRTQVRVWNEHFETTCFTADVSNSGVLIETARRIPIGTRVHIEVKVGERSFFSEATVARRRESPSYAHSFFKPAIGLRFIGLVEALRELDENEAADLLQETQAEAKAQQEESGAGRSGPEPASEVLLDGEIDGIVDLRDLDQLRFLYERDLSKGGLLVESRELAQIGSLLRVVIRLPRGHGDLPVRGTVVSAFSDSHEVGLLLEDRKEIRRRILEILESAA
jgi:hypothetical protein